MRTSIHHILLFLPFFVGACMNQPSSQNSVGTSWLSPLRVYALRLHPGDDLKKSLSAIAQEQHLSAGFILTCVGSVQKATLRLANASAATVFEGKYEIVSLTGTLASEGVHLHIALSDSQGTTIGGHLMDGTLIFTTAEIVVGNADALLFRREQDSSSGFKELRIDRK